VLSTEERKELLIDASTLAYTAIRLSALHKRLSGAEIVELGRVWGGELVGLLARRCEERIEGAETKRRAKDATSEN